MNCDCLTKIDERLKEKNLHLTGCALAGPDWKTIFYINTDWIDTNAAPKGKKKSPPKMFVSHCPFCGVSVKAACEHKWQWNLSSGEIWGQPDNLDSYDTGLIIGKCQNCGVVHKPKEH